MKHLREIMGAMSLHEMETICMRYAQQKAEASIELQFQEDVEMAEYVHDMAENSHRMLFHFILHGIYAIDNKDIGK